jgi:hypothetical protein
MTRSGEPRSTAQPGSQLRAYFSTHAKIRLEERTGLSVAALGQLLDEDRAASLGYHLGYRHWHRLVYSAPDFGYFVVVQDHRDGGVITVIPLANYVEHFGRVSDRRLRKALERADPLNKVPPNLSPEGHPSFPPGLRLVVAAATKDEKTIPIGMYAFAKTILTEGDVLAEVGFRAMVTAKLAERGLQMEDLNRIVVRRRRTRCLMLIELPHRDFAG